MKRIYAREEVCIACHLCEVHCQLAHSPVSDPVKAFNKNIPPLPRLRIEERRPITFSLQCRHCEEPACVESCLAGAIQKDPETGIVTVNEEKCIGCWTCVLACPWGAIRQDNARGHIVKCDLCPGRDTPACVANCPNGALVYVEGGD
ncbi:MAG: 4Fe-4S dicluster domain-containing protein [Chloroflexi bacterium]|nr:4Fe-4S dicluster domain-containing protein [Chloroflexota bacterium]